jgi:CubicO group peptidase (beta-lactamase class C family)
MRYVAATRSRTILSIFACLGLALPGPGAGVSAQAFAPDEEVQAILDQRVEEGRATGIVVGLLNADGTRRYFAAGSSGPDAAPLSAKSVFEIGSITKVFTGILLAEMSLRGELALEDPVQRHLPQEVKVPVRNGQQIRLVDLSTHRSSLPRLPANLLPPDVSNPYAHYSVEDLYEFLNGHELSRDIGSEGEYSNLAVGLLGHTLALVAGMDYEGLVKDRILEPLGMTMSGITLSESMQDHLALGHGAGGDVVPNWDLPTLAGAGALRSTAEDMLTFLEANIGKPGTPLEEAMRLSHQPREDLGGARIGLNWITRAGEDVTVVWHNGGTGGYRTFAGFDPEAERAVVVLTNSSQGADDIGFHLLDPSIPLTLQNGRLRAQATNQGRYSIFPESETTFFYKVVDAQITFERDDDGVATGLVLHLAGRSTSGRKIE